jgi:hypothetical protein
VRSDFLVSFGINNVLPLRAGDVFRTFFYQRQLRCGAWEVMATMAVERGQDLLALLCIFLTALLFLPDGAAPITLVLALKMALVIGATAVLGIFVVPAPLARWLGGPRARTLAARSPIVEAIRSRAFQVLEGVLLCRSRLPVLSLLTAAGWSLEAAVFASVTAGFVGRDFSVLGPLLAFSAKTLSTLLPGAPGHVGTYHFFAALGMETAGPSIHSSAAIAVLSHFIVWAPVTAIAAMLFWFGPVGGAASFAPRGIAGNIKKDVAR